MILFFLYLYTLNLIGIKSQSVSVRNNEDSVLLSKRLNCTQPWVTTLNYLFESMIRVTALLRLLNTTITKKFAVRDDETNSGSMHRLSNILRPVRVSTTYSPPLNECYTVGRWVQITTFIYGVLQGPRANENRRFSRSYSTDFGSYSDLNGYPSIAQHSYSI